MHFLLFLVHVFLYLDSAFFVLWGLVEDALLFKVVLLELFVLGTEMLIDVDQVVDLLIEDINIGQEIIVLFLALDESVLNFLNVSESSRFFDCVKSLVDDLHIPLIVVNQLNLFLIIDDEFS